MFYIVLFKVDLHALFLELPNGRQAVHGIPGESADGFGDDQVNPSGKRIGYHALKALAVFGVGASDALVRVDLNEIPILAASDVVRVIVDLRFITGILLVAVC